MCFKTLFLRYCAVEEKISLRNEVMCVLGGQRAAKVLGVKVWGLKKNLPFMVLGYFYSWNIPFS